MPSPTVSTYFHQWSEICSRLDIFNLFNRWKGRLSSRKVQLELHFTEVNMYNFFQLPDLPVYQLEMYYNRLRGHLTHEAVLMAANALVRSRLDYCNSLFIGLSALDLRKLQCVQNSLARIVANTTNYSHITPVRNALHWLLIEYCSIFKTAMLIYKFLHIGNPKYF